jgi:TolB-like protein/Tfp pilus assembly protein PilF
MGKDLWRKVKTTMSAGASYSGQTAPRRANAIPVNDLPSTHPKVRFGQFEVDFESRELRKQGMRIRLEEKPFQVLELLLERAGQVVTRRALSERLWPDTHVGFEHSLNTAVNKLREHLGDSAQSPRYVETLPRLGYRFIGEIEKQKRAASLTGKRMVAVLPLENLSGSREEEYFADGLTEEMISQLGQVSPKRLGVISRTSSSLYKGTKKPIGTVADELGVQFLIEGSVRREGKRVRITVQLIDSQDQTHLWSASYDRDLRDVLSVQVDVARQIGRALAFELLPDDPSKALVFDPSAHEAYLRGRFYFGQRSEAALQKAINSFQSALSIEPGCARSLSGIADSCNLLCWFGAVSPRDAGSRAGAAARRAIEIDGMLCEPHASLALVRFWYEWDWKAAEESFLRAIDLNPSYSFAHQWYASFLNAMGRFEEAHAQHRRARDLDPLSLLLNMGAADPFFFSRQFDRAIEHLQTLLEHEPRFFPALFNLGRTYVEKGMFTEAIEAFEKAVGLSGNREGLPALAHAYARNGQLQQAREILEDLKNVPEGRYQASTMIARVYLGLGEVDKAFEWLWKGLEERSFWSVFLRVDPVYDAIRPDPRFQDLLESAGLASKPQTV